MVNSNFFLRIANNGISFAQNESEEKQIVTINYLSALLVLLTIVGASLSFIDQYIVAAYSYLFLLSIQIVVFFLQRSGHSFVSKLLLSFLPPLILVVPLSLIGNVSQFYIDYFHALMAASVIPMLLFHNVKERTWLIVACLYSLLFILTYDTVLGFNSAPNVKFDEFNADFLRYKIRQLLFYGIVIGGYLVKIRLSQHFEQRLFNSKIELEEKNRKINEVIGAIQIQNEELQAQQEEMRAQNDDLHFKQQEIINLNAQIEQFTSVLMALAKSKNLKKGDLKSILIEISQITSQNIDVERVSIWEFDHRKQSLVCQNLYQASLDSNTYGLELKEADYSAYFEAINTEEILVAENALEHAATACFVNGYLDVYRIYSMLDVPFYVNGELRGVVCCETVGELKKWSKEEISFVKSVADLVSLGYEASDRKKAEERIRIQREEILSKNEALLIQQENIRNINESLERKISERTVQLEKRNSQLQEYTYVNSHLLRGPLCRILGIIYLVENNLIEDTKIDFVQHLKESAGELDDMVKKITRNLEKEHPISAEDILIQNNYSESRN